MSFRVVVHLPVQGPASGACQFYEMSVVRLPKVPWSLHAGIASRPASLALLSTWADHSTIERIRRLPLRVHDELYNGLQAYINLSIISRNSQAIHQWVARGALLVMVDPVHGLSHLLLPTRFVLELSLPTYPRYSKSHW